MPEKRKKRGLDPRLSPERMTPIGVFLYKHLEAKNMTIATLAKSLGMERQESMVRRIFYGPTKKFLRIDKVTLIRVLGLEVKDEKEFEALVADERITFGVRKSIPVIKQYDTLEWAEHREPDLIYRLQKGELEYVMQEATWSYNKIRNDKRLPKGDKEVIKWLLRYEELMKGGSGHSLTEYRDGDVNSELEETTKKDQYSDR